MRAGLVEEGGDRQTCKRAAQLKHQQCSRTMATVPPFSAPWEASPRLPVKNWGCYQDGDGGNEVQTSLSELLHQGGWQRFSN